MLTKQQKIEQLMHVYWETDKSPTLYVFAGKILRSAELGSSDAALKQQLATFQLEKLYQVPSNQACDQIIEWLRKVMSGDAYPARLESRGN